MRQPSRYRGALPRAAIRILILIVAPHSYASQSEGSLFNANQGFRFHAH